MTGMRKAPRMGHRRAGARPPAGGGAHVSRIEWALVVALIAAGGVVTAVLADGMWLNADVWAMLTGRELSADGLLDDHGGHWTTWNILVVKALYAGCGVDCGALWFLPRVLVWAALCLAMWRLLRFRGTDPLLAVAAVAVLSVFGLMDWLQGWTTGNPLAHLLTAGAAFLLAEGRPTWSNRILLAGLLMGGVMSAGVGLTVLAGALLTVAVVRSARGWWPSVLLPLVVYAGWYLVYRQDETGPRASVPGILDLPDFVFRVARHAVHGATALPTLVSGLVVVGLIAWLAWLVVRGRLDGVDALYLFSAGVFLTLALAVRVSSGDSNPEATRYGSTLVLFLVPVLLPRVPRVTRRSLQGVVVLVAAALVSVNVVQLRTGLDFWVSRSLQSQAVVESAAALVVRGEPYRNGALIDPPRSGQLTAQGLERLVSDGWQPDADPGTVAEARARLRVEALRTEQAGTSCLPMLRHFRADLAEQGLIVTGPPNAGVKAMWSDAWGSGTAVISLGAEGRKALWFDAVPGARLLLDPARARFEFPQVCRLAAPWE